MRAGRLLFHRDMRGLSAFEQEDQGTVQTGSDCDLTYFGQLLEMGLHLHRAIRIVYDLDLDGRLIIQHGIGPF